VSVLKILAICQCLDLSEKELGITPAWWQILKGLHELGAEVVAIPYYRRAVQSLWWETYENPNMWKNNAYDKVEKLACSLGISRNKMDFRQRNQKIIRFLVRNSVRKTWEKRIKSVLDEEKDVDAIIVLTVPLNQFSGIPKKIKEEFGIPIVFYDGDTPTSLPSHGGLSFSFYNGADPSEYDAFIINSKGAADEVKKLGANKVYTVYWGADPSVFCPIDGEEKVYDVGFYGIGSKLREEWIKTMMVDPSLNLASAKWRVGASRFAICGRAFDMNLGAVQLLDPYNLSYRRFSCQTKVDLSIVRKPHATVYASSTSRIFELASMGCCIVSNPYDGIEEWFDVGKEVLVAKDGDQVQELYGWLLSDEEARLRMGEAARQKALQQHTHRHRAQEILNILKKL
jgi:glycosyltransferase involved in cell wall biosynthesis